MHWRVPLRRAMGRSRSETGGGGEGGGDVARSVDSGEEGGSGSEDGSDWRDAERGDVSGKEIGTVIGRSVTVVSDTEGRRDGEERSSPDGVDVK